MLLLFRMYFFPPLSSFLPLSNQAAVVVLGSDWRLIGYRCVRRLEAGEGLCSVAWW